ncbi:MAG: DUF3574 domain-containing protein [Acetobacteraceae bacterium]
MVPGLIRSVVIGLALLAGCAPSPARMSCPAGMGPPMLLYNLYFGRSIPGIGEVTDREWSSFMDRVVTPNLPNGYTVYNASGAWMNPITQKTIKSPTKVLQVALPDTPESFAAITRIRSAYQSDYRQELVGMTVHPACGSF